ncbi:MAG: glucosamine-6-phosphate deaminase [Bacteroidota bacterium]|nr:glucosamine-6-phosphate deaminase [Bacteroidota bacterium]
MEIFIADTYPDLSKQAANDLVQLMRSRKHPLLCTASGDTPAGLYKNIVDKVAKKELDISGWFFVGLDEWTGMNGDDEGSCRFHLNNQLFRPLQVADNKIFFFDGRAKDLHKECEDAENFIVQQGGIDVAILGLGMNGHIGMNEPGTSQSLRSHVTALDPITQQTGQKYFKKQQQLTGGITLGLATLLDAKHIILLVSGSHKAGIVKKILDEKISEQVPGSLLRQHPGLKIYLDADAAKEIQSKYP